MKKNTRNLLPFLFAMFSIVAWGQETFEQRLSKIGTELNEKSVTTIPGLNEIAKFSVEDAPIQDLIKGLAETHQLNVSVSPTLKASVTNNFTNVVVKDLILFLCRDYRLDLEFINNILSFSKFQDPPIQIIPLVRKMPAISYDPNGELLSVDLLNDSLSVFIRSLSRISGKNIVLGPSIPEKLVNGYISKVKFDIGLNKIAYANGLEVEVDSIGQFFIIKERNKADSNDDNVVKRKTSSNSSVSSARVKNKDTEDFLLVEKNGRGGLNVEAYNVPISDVIKEAALISGSNYVFLIKPEGNTFIKATNISYSDLLSLLLKGTDRTFLVENEVYIIGNRNDEGFRKTKLIKLQYRTAWNLEKSIPQVLLKGIQVLPFEELNALILSGSTTMINEVERYIKEIDQPVPNILIDVMVIDLRKSYSIETGLTAMFGGDSTVQSQGKIYPGVDAVIGSGGINSIIDKIGSGSTVNLGRVKPNFYIKLKALESNGNIKIRSTPKLASLNGHEATLTIGKSVYYEEKTQNVTGGINPIITTTPRYSKVDANLTIKIKPMVSGDENVTLDIDAEFSDFLPPEIKDAPPGNATRKFVSQIRVLNGESVLLGGLEEATKEAGGSGIPILSRIPILKWIFSSRSKKDTSNKLLILIKPQIIY